MPTNDFSQFPSRSESADQPVGMVGAHLAQPRFAPCCRLPRNGEPECCIEADPLRPRAPRSCGSLVVRSSHPTMVEDRQSPMIRSTAASATSDPLQLWMNSRDRSFFACFSGISALWSATHQHHHSIHTYDEIISAATAPRRSTVATSPPLGAFIYLVRSGSLATNHELNRFRALIGKVPTPISRITRSMPNAGDLRTACGPLSARSYGHFPLRSREARIPYTSPIWLGGLQRFWSCDRLLRRICIECGGIDQSVPVRPNYVWRDRSVYHGVTLPTHLRNQRPTPCCRPLRLAPSPFLLRPQQRLAPLAGFRPLAPASLPSGPTPGQWCPSIRAPQRGTQ